MTASQLWAVVTTNSLRHCTLGDDLIEHPRNAQACEARVHLHGQALARVCIDHVEHTDRAARVQHVMHEVKCPLLAGSCVNAQWRAHAHAVFSILSTQGQASLAVDPMHAFTVSKFASARQKHMQALIAEARLLSRQGNQLLAQSSVVLPRLV